MENIRTNKAARAAAMLLVLVLITMCILSGTLAKYITKDSGSDSARVAKFGVVASVSGNLFGYAYKADGTKDDDDKDRSAIAEYGTSDEGYAVRAYSNTESGKVVAPGTYNDKGMTISLMGKPEVATKVEPSFTTEDIVLKAGEYGVMVPVAVNKIDPDDYASYYTLSGDTYTKATSLPESGNVYKLQDRATVGFDYYPLNWSLAGAKVTDVTDGRLSAVMTNIKAIYKEAENNPNYDYSSNVGSATITWAWPFADDYGDGTDLTTRDRADTILGDLIASPMDNGKVVVKDSGSYKAITVSGTKATIGTGESAVEVANLKAEVNASLTVKQIVKKSPVIPEGAQLLGGKIFYATPSMDGDTKAKYKFYKFDGTEITSWSVDSNGKVTGLDTAVSYDTTAAAGSQNFYVMGTDGSGNPLTVSGTWGTLGEQTDVTANGIGDGKTNTATLVGKGGDTVFTKVAALTAGGHSDWFIGTKAEQDKLIASGEAGTLYDSLGIWSSVEIGPYDSAYGAYCWQGMWDYCSKNDGTKAAVALRAF